MKVKQLIAALEAHDPDDEVGMDFGDGYMIPIAGVDKSWNDVLIHS